MARREHTSLIGIPTSIPPACIPPACEVRQVGGVSCRHGAAHVCHAHMVGRARLASRCCLPSPFSQCGRRRAPRRVAPWRWTGMTHPYSCGRQDVRIGKLLFQMLGLAWRPLQVARAANSIEATASGNGGKTRMLADRCHWAAHGLLRA